MINRSLIFIIFSFPFVGCELESEVKFTREELIRLISADSVKTWIQADMVIDGEVVELTGCEKELNFLFNSESDQEEAGEIEIKTNPENCDGEELVVFSGFWLVNSKIDSNGSADSLYFTDGTGIARYAITVITSVTMELSGISGEKNIRIEFQRPQP